MPTLIDFPVHALPISELPAALIPQDTRGERLWVRGSPRALELIAQLPERGLGIVGTRRPQPRALELTRRVVSQLRGMRIVVISGLALGIDAQAHETALAAELPTIAILAGGLDTPIYPARNAGLALRILERGGLLVSEYPPEFEPKPWAFVQRNRWIAAWSKATWIAQACDQSGALITGNYAIEHHRDLYCTPGFPGDPTLAGNQRFLDEGSALALWDAGSLGKTWLEFSALGSRRPAQRELQLIASAAPLGPTEETLLSWIRSEISLRGSVRFERLFELALESETPIDDVQRATKTLMTLGFIEERASGALTIRN